MSWDSFFASLDSLCQDAADFAGTSPRSVCRLLTADTDGILVADDSSMVSLIGIGGSLRLIGEEEFEKAASALTGVLKTPLSRRCHAVQMVFSCDPGAAEEHISAAMKPVRESAGLLSRENLPRRLDKALCHDRSGAAPREASCRERVLPSRASFRGAGLTRGSRTHAQRALGARTRDRGNLQADFLPR